MFITIIKSFNSNGINCSKEIQNMLARNEMVQRNENYVEYFSIDPMKLKYLKLNMQPVEMLS